MASSILRRIFRHDGGSSGFCRSFNLGGHRMMSSGRMLPWLMLPPVSDAGGGVAYRYYSLSEKKVVSIINQRRSGEPESESPAEDAEFVGSSHGWISSYNRRTHALFLSNPITNRHIKLPPIRSLPDREMNARIGRGNVSKLILSSPSPDDESCRALMTFGPANRLAFCSPADCLRTSSDSYIDRPSWTPMGDLYGSEIEDDETIGLCAHVFEDMVYCGKRKAFCTITPCELDLDSFENMDFDHSQLNFWKPWNPGLKEAGYGPIIVEEEKEKEGDTLYWVKENKGVLQHQCVQIPHIVYAEDPDQIYVVLRFVILMNSDGITPVDKVPVCEFAGLRGSFPSKTVGFVVLKVIEDAYAGEIVDDLGGLAMFVGINHSFALPASGYPGLKPDSIYFADSKRLHNIKGRNDVGIFDYQNKTITEVVSSHEIGLSGPTPPPPPPHGPVMPSPMWFTPHSLDL